MGNDVTWYLLLYAIGWALVFYNMTQEIRVVQDREQLSDAEVIIGQLMSAIASLLWPFALVVHLLDVFLRYCRGNH